MALGLEKDEAKNLVLSKQRAKAVVDYLIKKGYPGLHIMAINPAPAMIAEFKRSGFDSISHYVWLPDWKGEYRQDYCKLVKKRSREWEGFADKSGLTYFPSVSPGWDATPRAAVNGYHKQERYPWWPVVVNEDPALFAEFLNRAITFTGKFNNPQLSFISFALIYTQVCMSEILAQHSEIGRFLSPAADRDKPRYNWHTFTHSYSKELVGRLLDEFL